MTFNNSTVIETFVSSIERHTQQEPYRKKLLLENAELFRNNLKRLAKFTGEEYYSMFYCYERLGISPYKHKKLDYLFDSMIYDIVEIYDLDKILRENNFDWDKTWEVIEKSLTDNSLSTPALESTVQKFKTAFLEIKAALAGKDLSKIQERICFEMFGRAEDTKELFIVNI
jgi:hypothetical protein